MKSAILVLFAAASVYAAVPILQSPPQTGHQWEVYELTFADSTSYQNPFWDVTIYVDFVSPAGVTYKVRGFYYDTFTWKIRFAPTPMEKNVKRKEYPVNKKFAFCFLTFGLTAAMLPVHQVRAEYAVEFEASFAHRSATVLLFFIVILSLLDSLRSIVYYAPI